MLRVRRRRLVRASSRRRVAVGRGTRAAHDTRQLTNRRLRRGAALRHPGLAARLRGRRRLRRGARRSAGAGAQRGGHHIWAERNARLDGHLKQAHRRRRRVAIEAAAAGGGLTPPMAVSNEARRRRGARLPQPPQQRRRGRMIARRMPAHPEPTPDRCAAAQKTAAATFWSVLLPATTPRALPLSVTASRPPLLSAPSRRLALARRRARRRSRGTAAAPRRPSSAKLLECDRPPTGGAALAVTERLDVAAVTGTPRSARRPSAGARASPRASAHDGAQHDALMLRSEGRTPRPSARRGGVQQRRRRPASRERGIAVRRVRPPWRVAVVAAGRRVARRRPPPPPPAAAGPLRLARVFVVPDSRARALQNAPQRARAPPPSRAARRAATSPAPPMPAARAAPAAAR